jgi:cytochrome c-type biogenesis protein CcmE
MSKGLQIALGAVAVAALLGWYAASNFEEIGTFRYFQTLAEFRAAQVAGAPARVHGYVASGSIVRDVEARTLRFEVVQDPPHAAAGAGADRLSVVYGSLETPDMFKDGAEVVVEGRLDAGAVFVADNVMAKCPSKFQAKQSEPMPERATF